MGSKFTVVLPREKRSKDYLVSQKDSCNFIIQASSFNSNEARLERSRTQNLKSVQKTLKKKNPFYPVNSEPTLREEIKADMFREDVSVDFDEAASSEILLN